MPNEVLLLGEYGIKNGGENSILAVVPLLMKQGWNFSAAVPAESPFEADLAAHGIQNLGLNFHDDSRVRLSQDQIRENFKELFAEARPDLIHCNSLSTSRLVGPVAKELSIPSLGYLRDILKLSKTAVSDINQLDCIVAVSAATRDWHISQGMDKEKIVVIHNGVDGEKFRPDVEQADLASIGIPSNDHVLLFVGQIGMRKGIDSLINVFAKVNERHPNVHFVIVGERSSTKQEAIDYESSAVERARQISSQIHWLGRREDIPALMNRASILVHTARQEPLGRVLLEALSSGLPFVATDVGGTREIVGDLESYDLLADSEIEIADRIDSLLNNERQRHEIMDRFRARAAEAFSIAQSADLLAHQYSLLRP